MSIEDKPPLQVNRAPMQRSGNKGGYLGFRVMFGPLCIQWLYVIGAISVTLLGVAFLARPEMVERLLSEIWPLNIDGNGFNILLGIVVIVVGNLLWRISCELMILPFGIHSQLANHDRLLAEMRDDLDRLAGR